MITDEQIERLSEKWPDAGYLLYHIRGHGAFPEDPHPLAAHIDHSGRNPYRAFPAVDDQVNPAEQVFDHVLSACRASFTGQIS